MDDREMPDGRVMDLAVAAKYLGIHPKSLRKLVADGAVPGRKVGRAWRFSRDGLDRWLSREDEREGLDAMQSAHGRPSDDWSGLSRGNSATAPRSGTSRGDDRAANALRSQRPNAFWKQTPKIPPK